MSVPSLYSSKIRVRPSNDSEVILLSPSTVRSSSSMTLVRPVSTSSGLAPVQVIEAAGHERAAFVQLVDGDDLRLLRLALVLQPATADTVLEAVFRINSMTGDRTIISNSATGSGPLLDRGQGGAAGAEEGEEDAGTDAG